MRSADLLAGRERRKLTNSEVKAYRQAGRAWTLTGGGLDLDRHVVPAAVAPPVSSGDLHLTQHRVGRKRPMPLDLDVADALQSKPSLPGERYASGVPFSVHVSVSKRFTAL